MKPTRYTDPNRLGDVMALIQVLALGRLAIRSEKELRDRLQGKPTSKATTWGSLAENHREFFRVLPSETGPGEGNVALIWREALPVVEGTVLRERQRPPLILGLVSILALLIRLYFKMPPAP